MLKVQYRKTGIMGSGTRTPPHRRSFHLRAQLCGPATTCSWCSPSIHPSILWCPLLCYLISSSSKSRQQSGSLGKWDSNTNCYKKYEELSMCRETCWVIHHSGTTNSSNMKLTEESWLKWQLACMKQELPPNRLSVNKKVTFVRSF